MILATPPHPAEPGLHLRPYRFRSVALTHPGCVRKLNEDAVLERPDAGLWAVADGMGGHAAGDFASGAVMRHLDSVSAFTSAFDFRRAVRAALLAANRELHEKADEELLDVIGATVVTLMVHRGHYACIWAGDSRAYRFRNGKLERLTQDHSLVQELVDAGSIHPAEARAHANSNIVTRAVGASERLDLDGIHGSIEPGDRFLLCSDGLSVLSEDEIERKLGIADTSLAAAGIMQAALNSGAPDNISLILVQAHVAEAHPRA
jgi:serine/threonine protein phosphatase Stp1